MARFWAIGDIHGLYDSLKAILTQINFLETKGPLTQYKSEKIIFLGDYIDHGPSSKEVIDLLIDIPKYWDKEFIYLAGNHEDMLLHFLHNTDETAAWAFNGGLDTLASFYPQWNDLQDIWDLQILGLSPDSQLEENAREMFADIDEKYLNFLENLVYAHKETITVKGKTHNFAFLHAGYGDTSNLLDYKALNAVDIEKQLRPLKFKEFNDYWAKIAEPESNPVWKREFFYKKISNYILVHGHTPTTFLQNRFKTFNPEFPAFIFDNLDFYNFTHPEVKDFNILSCINLDTGAVYGRRLTAVFISDKLLEEQGLVYVLQIDIKKGYRMRKNVLSKAFFRV